MRRISEAAVILFLSASAQAAVLSIDPVTQTVGVGHDVTLAVNISRLGDEVAPSLGGFNIFLDFDPTILAFDSVVFGNQLDLGIEGSLTLVDDSNPGVLELFELSEESISDLDLSQPGAFTLARVTFQAIAAGVSDISFGLGPFGFGSFLSDALGDPIDFTAGSASVKVAEPSTLLLLGLGLAGLGFARRRKA